MPDMEVEVQIEGHAHLFVVDVESVLEAQQLKGSQAKCTRCGHRGIISRVGIPGRKQRGERPTAPGQKSMFKEDQ